MKQQYNIAEAKSHFSELVKRALLGEDIVIARYNKSILRLAPVIEGRKERLPVTVRFPVHVLPEAHALKSSPCAFGCPNHIRFYLIIGNRHRCFETWFMTRFQVLPKDSDHPAGIS